MSLSSLYQCIILFPCCLQPPLSASITASRLLFSFTVSNYRKALNIPPCRKLLTSAAPQHTLAHLQLHRHAHTHTYAKIYVSSWFPPSSPQDGFHSFVTFSSALIPLFSISPCCLTVSPLSIHPFKDKVVTWQECPTSSPAVPLWQCHSPSMARLQTFIKRTLWNCYCDKSTHSSVKVQIVLSLNLPVLSLLFISSVEIPAVCGSRPFIIWRSYSVSILPQFGSQDGNSCRWIGFSSSPQQCV